MHDLANPIDAAPGVLGLAIPNAPSQPLDRFDDRRFRLHPPSIVGQQAARGLRRVLESHREVEQSKMSGAGIPAFTRMVRRPGQPSVKAVTIVALVRPATPRFRRSRAEISVKGFATAPNTCLPPPGVSTFPTRTSGCRSSFSRPRMKVESRLTVIAADAGAAGWPESLDASCWPIRMVRRRNVSGLLPASTGSKCCSTPVATR